MTLHRQKNFCASNTKTVSGKNSLSYTIAKIFCGKKTIRAQAGIAFAVYKPNVKVRAALEAGDKLRLPSGFVPSEGAKKTTENSVVSFASFAVKPRERSP